jgi:hypothetical protein
MQIMIDDCATNLKTMPPVFMRMVEYLDALKDGQMKTTETLANGVGCAQGTPLRMPSSTKDEYSAIMNGNKRVWGNKRTVIAFKEQA